MKIIVTKDTVKIEEFDLVHEGEHKVNKCSFSFSEEYTKELVKKAIFTSQNSSVEVAIINNECDIPTEILRARNIVLLGVYAYKVTEDKLDLRYSPSPDAFKVNDGSYIEGASDSEEITPSQFEQYMQALNDGLNKVEKSLTKMDEATSSANDLVNDINQKLENGDFIGPQGTQGIPGKDGIDGINGQDGVGITTITSGQSTVEEDKTITPITVTKTDGSSQNFNVEAKNGIDGQNGKDGTNGQDGLTPSIGENGNWFIGDTDTGKPSRGEVGPSPDLSDYVKNTDYANGITGGTVKSANQFFVTSSNGYVYSGEVSKDAYKSIGNSSFISKGTLENIKDDYVGSSQPVQDLTATVTNVQDDQDESKPKQTASGEMITVDDALAYKTFNVMVDGASEQENTTGKAIVDLNSLTEKTINGITFTPVFKNGLLEYINVNGISTAICWYIMANVTLEENQVYSFLANSTDENVRFFTNTSGYVTTKVENKTNSQTSSQNISINVDTGKTINNARIYPMIAKSTTIEEYEPYTGGQPSPSPDYPQPITTLTFDKITRCGKNLYNVTDINTYYSNAVGEDVSVDEEGWITIDVDNSQSSSEKFNNYWTNFSHLLKPNTNYNIFLEIKEVSGTGGYISVTNDTYNSQFNNSFSSNLKNLSSNSIKNQICITKQNYMVENITMLRTFLSTPANCKNKIKFRISVIEDTTITSQKFIYEPYQATEYAIDLQGNEMVELPNGVKDELIIDKYGNVNLIKNVGKKILNGSEDWMLNTNYTTSEMLVVQYLENDMLLNSKIISDRSTYNAINEINTIRAGAQFVLISLDIKKFATVDDFKRWLSTHNTTVYYQLANPQPISLGKLSDIITTLNGTNKISINGNIPTTISTTYALDIKKYIDNKLAEISTAMIEEG